MPFSSKLKADYVEMINGELDNIPIFKKEEFALVAQELENCLNSCFVLAIKSLFGPAKKILPKEIQDQITYVRYCLETPKDFVASKENYDEYQKILIERIKAKITELRSYTNKGMEDYITFQKEKHPQLENKAYDVV